MTKVYEFLAEGFEEVEAMLPVDILRRAGIEVKTVSVMDSIEVMSAHQVGIKADMMFTDSDFSDATMLLLPGGLPGATNLRDHAGLSELLCRHAAEGKKIGAICAAPLVLGTLGLLRGRRATCYPGFEKYLDGADYTAELFTIDGNIITGEGPAATFPYAYAIAGMFVPDSTVDSLREGMMYKHLMTAKC